jgi:sec-independent protein translocase protein TatB
MNILGIGPLELFFILIIAIIILGPKDIVKASRIAGKWLRQTVTSDTWKTVRDTSREIKNLPNKLMREAGLDEIKDGLPTEGEIRKAIGYDELQDATKNLQSGLSDWTSPSNKPSSTTSTKSTAKDNKPKTTGSTSENTESDWATPRPKKTQPESPSLSEGEEVLSTDSETTPTFPPPIVSPRNESEEKSG